jgi:GTP-binding protein
MQIKTASFLRGMVGPIDILTDGTPQVAFIGRSNAGKSSLLNSLTKTKKLAITSKTPGRTKEINVFLVNGTHYFMDLPGYGYAKASGATIEKLGALISWYLFRSDADPTVVVLIDAFVGPTKDDMAMLQDLMDDKKRIVIVANKIDKVKSSKYQTRIRELRRELNGFTIIPYSSKTGAGVQELTDIVMEVETETTA